MTMRRRLKLARSAQLDVRIVKDVAAAQRRRSDGRFRVGITYPLRDGAEEGRALARGIADALSGWSTFVLPVMGHVLRPRAPDVDALLMLAPIDHADELPPTVMRIAWVQASVRAWPDHVLDAADLVLAASPSLADELAAQLNRDIPVALPAIAPERASGADRRADLALVADASRSGNALAGLMSPEIGGRLRLHGPGWDADARFGAVPTDQADPEEVHRSSRLVLGLRDPHRRSLDPGLMRAAMRGALPITDDIESAALFAGRMPMFGDRSELANLVREFSEESVRRPAVDVLREEIRRTHTFASRSAELTELIEGERTKATVAITICTPDAAHAERWGDTHFARQLAGALRRTGMRPRVVLREDWHDRTEPPDVAIHVRGLEALEPRASHRNLLWIISHPERVTAAECERYDAVFVASAKFADQLRSRVDVPVHTMYQAADPNVFRFVAAVPALRSDLLFVGNSRLPVRQVPRWLLELDAPLTIYGARWDELEERRFVRGDFIANRDLHAVYRSADIVVNDHWADMRTHGFVSNRIFDALACGAFVISDHLDEIPELFGDDVPTFASREELAHVVATFADDPVARTQKALGGRRTVLAHHTFDARARQIRQVLDGVG